MPLVNEKKIAQRTAGTLAELLEKLNNAAPDQPSIVYITNTQGEALYFEVFEETLSDGSLVYNIRFS